MSLQKLEVFGELLGCVGDISLWHLDAQMDLVKTNSPNPEILTFAFAAGGSLDAVRSAFEQNRMPVIVENGISISWLAAPSFVQDTLVDVYLIGPVFTSAVSEEYLLQRIRALNVPTEWEKIAVQNLDAVPIVSYQTLMQYGVMLFYCITGQKIIPEAIRFLNQHSLSEKEHQKHSGALEYAFQMEIMQAVEEGNVDYVHPKYIYSISVGTVSKEGPLRQAKNIMITFITEITRAAIRGGMSAADAFDLSDHYILISEDCTNEAEVYQNGQTCLRDFTQRVHRIRQSGYSRATRDCLDYIARNIKKQITMDGMATELRYSKNYLSTKIHKETGKTIRQIITEEKLKQAAIWLAGSTRPIQDICHDLCFDSPSYFSSRFRRIYGMTPKQYRQTRGHAAAGPEMPNRRSP